MRLDVGCVLGFQAPWPIHAAILLMPQSGDAQEVVAHELIVTPALDLVEYVDAFGNLAHRVTLPVGASTVSIAATVDTDDEIDVDTTAPRTEFERLPDWVLQFCLPSRYCESDDLVSLALEITAGALPGYPQVEAIRRWIATNILYEYGVSLPTTSAKATLQARAGVCRDFAHLGISLCRALQIPARMVVGWLHELVPMDQHAWFEAYVGDRWFTFDATQKVPLGNRVAIGYGRDATDVAIVTQFGPLELTTMAVTVQASPPATSAAPAPPVDAVAPAPPPSPA